MVVLYMVGAGMMQASCAVVGQQIGAGDEGMARMLYKSFQIVAGTMIIFVMVLQYIWREEIVNAYTE